MSEHRTRPASDSLTTIDRIAGESRFRRVSAGLKSALAVLLIISVVGFRSLWTNLFVLVGMIALSLAGGVPFRIYLKIMRVPLIFLFMSGIVMLFDCSKISIGLLSIPMFGGWIVVTPDSLKMTIITLSTALSAVSVLKRVEPVHAAAGSHSGDAARPTAGHFDRVDVFDVSFCFHFWPDIVSNAHRRRRSCRLFWNAQQLALNRKHYDSIVAGLLS